jgi:hypothetical protein
MSPFYANYEFNLKDSWETRDMKYLIKITIMQTDKLKDLYRELSKNIE